MRAQPIACLCAATLLPLFFATGCLDFNQLSSNWEAGATVDMAEADEAHAQDAATTDAARDLTVIDMVVRDFKAPPDLTAPVDLARLDLAKDGAAADMAANIDMPVLPDISGAQDFAVPPDLSIPEDLMPVRDFAPPPPDLTTVPDLSCPAKTTPCDVFCQNCGSPNTLKCGVVGGSIACIQTGTVSTDRACNKTADNCMPRNVCLQVAQSLSLCRLFCNTDADCTNGGRCMVNVPTTQAQLKACTDPVKTCDPVAQSGCDGVGNCFVVTPTGLTGCHGAGTGGQGDGCITSYDCKAQHTCHQGKCRQLCRAGSDCTGILSFCTVDLGWGALKGCS